MLTVRRPSHFFPPSFLVITFFEKGDADLVSFIEDALSNGTEFSAGFSRNRMFRKGLRKKQLIANSVTRN